jgi:hypothetical protein
METIKGKIFENIALNTAVVIEGIRFEDCIFGQNIEVGGFPKTPADAPVIRNCEFVDCTFTATDKGGCFIGFAIFENVLVQDCRVNGGDYVVLDCTKMDKVIFKGSFGVDTDPDPSEKEAIANYSKMFGSPFRFKTLRDSYVYFLGLEPEERKKYDIPDTSRGAYRCFNGYYEKPEDLLGFRADYNNYLEKVEMIADFTEAHFHSLYLDGEFPSEKMRNVPVNP